MPDLLRGVREMGFTRPTPIQSDAIPPAMEGRDVLACAMTGSGKTAAFLLPILNRLIGKKRGVTRALILTPTRELAAQIEEHAKELAVHTALSAAAVFGGVGMGPQEHAFRTGVDVIVATPGRLLDHFRFPYARLDGLEILVLDEADRMLDMGFLPDIRRVLKHLPAKRQTLFFSATMPPPIAQLTREMLQESRSRSTWSAGRRRPSESRRRSTRWRRTSRRRSSLELLKRGDIRNVLVFTRTKHRANRLAETLTKKGVPCERIHGNRSQAQRTQALAGFKAGKHRVLVATDIAARGIDVEALVARRQLRRARRSRRLHPPRRPHRPRRDDRRRVHVRLSRGAERSRGDRAGDRQALAARHGAGVRLREGPRRAVRGSHRRADRPDPGAQGRGAPTGEGEGTAANRQRGGAAEEAYSSQLTAFSQTRPRTGGPCLSVSASRAIAHSVPTATLRPPQPVTGFSAVS